MIEELNDKVAWIKNLGFVFAGRWTFDGTRIKCEMDESYHAACGAYAFVVNNELMYIGKTVLTFRERMQRYRTPPRTAANGATTNIANNRLIRKHLDQEHEVLVFVFPGGGELEGGLISVLSPPWNGGKKGALSSQLMDSIPA
ncbi:MAG: hypothetical protein U0793_26535 [Gemmataceae bacterium]